MWVHVRKFVCEVQSWLSVRMSCIVFEIPDTWTDQVSSISFSANFCR